MRAAVVLALSSLAVPTAFAQNAEQVVTDLNQQAMEAYNQLDIDKAGSMLEEALRVAVEGGVTPQLLGRTNLNLGVVYIGGLNDEQTGMNYFVQAVCADPAIQLDPLTSTPEIQNAFQAAQAHAMKGACPSPAGPAQGGPGVAPSQATLPPPPSPEQAIMHQPPVEQLSQTPLPIYLEVDPAARPKRVGLFYKGLGMDSYKRVLMFTYKNGFAYQLTCEHVWEPKVSYYIEAVDADDKIVGVAGSAGQPIEVPVVAARTQAEPALPGEVPPLSCAAQECPPGIEGCVKPGKAAIGESCSKDTDCQSGLSCNDDEECMLIGAGPTEVSDDAYDMDGFDGDGDSYGPEEFERGFFQLGLAVGLSWVTPGMVADRPAPADRVYTNVNPATPGAVAMPAYVDPVGNFMGWFPEAGTDSEELLTAWQPDADSSDSFGPLGGSCPADGIATSPTNGDPALQVPSKYCVRVKRPGIVQGLALRSAVGYFVTQDISLAAVFRFQFSAGEGSLSAILVGARAEILLTPPEIMAPVASIFLGGTFGQIQAKPKAPGDTEDAPFVKSGLMGGHVGSNIRYRFHPNFGVFAAPEIDVQFPTFMLHMDLTLGAEGAF